MRFQVPQFIEVESKIFGQLTLKQFIYLVGGAGIIFILYVILPAVWLTILFAIPVAGLSLALAFYKVNNQPFINALENAFRYFFANKIFIWKKEERPKKPEVKKQEQSPTQEIVIPKITQSKLKDLAWSLDIKEKI